MGRLPDYSSANLPAGELRGTCWVIDGDTIVIGTTHIRLAGIDAPELDHPFGQQSKWALIKLCKGQVITACFVPELSYDRQVAQCFLPDGRDLAAELVKAGLALDWPKFSGGRYRHLEPTDVRQKLWRANMRQGGKYPWQPTYGKRPTVIGSPEKAHRRTTPMAYRGPTKRSQRQLRWVLVPLFLIAVVGCALVQTGKDGAHRPVSNPGSAHQVVTSPGIGLGLYEVTADVLNVRARPSPTSEVIAQLTRGSVVRPVEKSNNWLAVRLADARVGWVYAQFLQAQ